MSWPKDVLEPFFNLTRIYSAESGSQVSNHNNIFLNSSFAEILSPLHAQLRYARKLTNHRR